jgi:hypothetical protein
MRVLPANEAFPDDLTAVFGTADYSGRCRRFKTAGWLWRDSTKEERTAMLRERTGHPTPRRVVMRVEFDPRWPLDRIGGRTGHSTGGHSPEEGTAHFGIAESGVSIRCPS